MLQPPPVPLNPIEGCSYSHPSLQGSPVLHMYRAVDYPEDIKNLITQDAFSGWAELRKHARAEMCETMQQNRRRNGRPTPPAREEAAGGGASGRG